MDMGCPHTFEYVLVKNSHNHENRDTSSKKLKITSSTTKWAKHDSEAISSVIELSDARNLDDPLPIQQIKLDKVHGDKQYVQVEIKEAWGEDGGGIDYFDIVREDPNKIFPDALAECKANSGDCAPKPQYCRASNCISETVWWQDNRHRDYYQQGCSTIGDDTLFDSAAKCVKKEAFDSLDPPFIFDTSDPSLMEDCSSWSDTEPCEEEYLHLADQQNLRDKDIVTDIFRISTDDCVDDRIKLELIDRTSMEPTGSFLSYTDTVNSSLLVGEDDEECLNLKVGLCGPDSITFTTPGDLFLTICDSILLFKQEFDFCGNSKNQCWRKQNFLQSYEDFKFLNEKKLFSATEEELANNIELMVKSEGFLAEKEFQIFPNLSLECLGNDQWVVSNNDFASDISVVELHKIPCLSSVNCTNPPNAGFAISTTTTDVENFEWMKTEVEYTCDDGKSVFYSEELNYTKSFKLSCEKDLIFGGRFPYWQIPGTEYPKKNEIICALPTKCYNFIDIDPQLKELGLSETFDRISIQNEEMFEYFCPNETRVHTRFTTSKDDMDIFHFVSTRSEPIKKTFNFRVIPEDSVEIIFSQSRNITNGTVSFILKEAQMEVKSKGIKLEFRKNKSYNLKTNSINDIEVLFTEKEINFHNKVILAGHFGDLHFIGFNSTKTASWIVKKIIPAELIMIDDGTSVSYHKTINATCKEKMLMDTFSGWELDLPKPLDEIQINCTQALRCDYEVGEAPIPIPEDNSVGFFLHLNFLGEPQAVNGPMEIGDSISIQCLEPGYTFDINFMHKNRIYPVEKLIGTCNPEQVDGLFPGWQWRPVHPVTNREEDEFQPFNTTIPSCRMCIPKYLDMKGFRITLDTDLTKRKGVACQSLHELRSKISIKFSLDKTFKIFTEDFTEIDDDEYFLSIPQNSLLIVSRSPIPIKSSVKSVSSAENIFDEVLSLLRWGGNTETIYQEVLDLLNEEFKSKWPQFRMNLKNKTSDNSKLSKKSEDPNWFKDLSTTAKTKEEFMFKNCQSRVRGYMSRAEAQINEASLSKSHKTEISLVMSQFKTCLKTNRYHGEYFDRSSVSSARICDTSGLFQCEGRYDVECCNYQSEHLINPYSSYEERILFSTWNLDHLIERSRSVIPSLIEAVKNKKTKQNLNTNYFYNLLFTRENLKLVHIVCHDKQEHSSKKCVKNKFYL